jgi:predicted RNA-binding Zn-ribbon protein involved in translation (DUF1610 family)
MKISPSEMMKSLEKSFFTGSKATTKLCHKTRHRSEHCAEYHIASLERSGYLCLSPDEKLVTYRCVHCGYWHIGRSHSHGVFIPRIDRRFRQLGLDE